MTLWEKKVDSMKKDDKGRVIAPGDIVTVKTNDKVRF